MAVGVDAMSRADTHHYLDAMMNARRCSRLYMPRGNDARCHVGSSVNEVNDTVSLIDVRVSANVINERKLHLQLHDIKLSVAPRQA